MKHPAYDIRVAVNEMLEAVTYESVVVKRYDEVTESDAIFPRIILQDITGGGPRDSKCGFGGDWQQNIKVSMSNKGRVTRNVNDDIANQILNILVPVSGNFIDIGPDFDVWKVEGRIAATQSYSDGIRNYLDTNIIITYSLTEN